MSCCLRAVKNIRGCSDENEDETVFVGIHWLFEFSNSSLLFVQGVGVMDSNTDNSDEPTRQRLRRFIQRLEWEYATREKQRREANAYMGAGITAGEWQIIGNWS